MKKILFAVFLSLITLGAAAHSTEAATYRTYSTQKISQAQMQRNTQKRYTTTSKNRKISNNYGYGVGGYRTTQVGHVSNTNVAWVPGPLEDWQIDRSQNNGYQSSNGRVLVNWGNRGGTCNIRYTEAGAGYFRYRTSAACDEVQHVVGSLQSGEQYQFQIAQDNWDNWSNGAVAVAR